MAIFHLSFGIHLAHCPSCLMLLIIVYARFIVSALSLRFVAVASTLFKSFLSTPGVWVNFRIRTDCFTSCLVSFVVSLSSRLFGSRLLKLLSFSLALALHLL